MTIWLCSASSNFGWTGPPCPHVGRHQGNDDSADQSLGRNNGEQRPVCFLALLMGQCVKQRCYSRSNLADLFFCLYVLSACNRRCRLGKNRIHPKSICSFRNGPWDCPNRAGRCTEQKSPRSSGENDELPLVEEAKQNAFNRSSISWNANVVPALPSSPPNRKLKELVGQVRHEGSNCSAVAYIDS